jgi:bifunctional non-homologous end joining protein LigD
MSLDRYRRKRDFARTPEPSGTTGRTGPAPGRRFVVQRHRARRLHYDFRLEIGGVLASWAVPKGPTLDPGVRRMAVHVEDHPLEYFDFEGVIPEGQYGAGDVIVWDWGTFEPELTADPAAAVRDGELKFRLMGEKLAGRFTIVRTGRGAGRPDDAERSWLLIKKHDDAAVRGWEPEAHPRSVKSGRTNDEVAAGADAAWISDAPAGVAEVDLSAARESPMPDFVEPMKATLAETPFSDTDWLFEVKWDGYRVEAVVRDGTVRLWTRNRQDAARYFPRLAGSPDWIDAREAIVDGEVVALRPDGTADFSLLQDATGVKGPGSARLDRTGVRGTSVRGTGVQGEAREGIHLAYEVFDLLHLDGRSLLDVPLEDRKLLLRSVLREHPMVRYAGHVEAEGESFFRAAAERGVEGMVAKLRRSRYEPGRRSRAWLKLKVRPEQELVVGGYVPGKGRSADLGALAVGVHEDGVLRYAGRVGSGFDDATRTALLGRLEPLRRPDSPFGDAPRLPGAVWVEPRIVIRVEFAEWTSDGLVRQAAYKGLELGREPESVTRERPAAMTPPAMTPRPDVPPADAPPAEMMLPPDVPPADAPPAKARRRHAASPASAARPRLSSLTDAGTPARTRQAESDVPQPAIPPAVAVARAPDPGSSTTLPASREGPADEAFAPATDEELAALDRLPARGGQWRVGAHEVSLTHLDRELFPAAQLTKRDLVRYYATIAPVLLPYLAGRALNLSRWPEGVDGPHFWQKEIPGWAPAWVSRRYLAGHTKDDSHTYVLADSAAALAWLANQAAIEIHPWTSRVDAPDRPTYALIDIDPGERTAWEDTVLLAQLYGKALRHLGVTGYPKTTGKRGIQVWIPIAPRYSFDETRAWVEQVSRAVARAVPELVSWEWEKSARRGRARLDYTQNAVNKTLVGPYVARARPNASVSAPISWDELDDPDLRPDRWTVATIGERLAARGDLFEGVLGEGQELPPL